MFSAEIPSGRLVASITSCAKIRSRSTAPGAAPTPRHTRAPHPGGGTRRQMLLEGALCGLITLALVPLLEWMGLPQGMATFAGGAVGFMGVEKLRGYSDLFLSRKAQG